MAPIWLLAACASGGGPSDPAGWFDPGTGYDVQEALAFTTDPYGLAGIGDLAGALFPVGEFDAIVYGEGEALPVSDCEMSTTRELPGEVVGVVTIHPRFYFKTEGCAWSGQTGQSDEKYYGSFFVEDDTGGFFVLGDSKVAHFDAGDRVRLRVRAARTSYDLDMVYAHDVLEIERDWSPIRYSVPEGPLGLSHVARVQRVEGRVVLRDWDEDGEVDDVLSGFGDVALEADDGTEYQLAIDVELNRRGIEFAEGERVQVTGPVLYSFSAFSIVVMELGQIARLD